LARQNFLSAESLFGKLQLDKEKKWKAKYSANRHGFSV
jgi:hypothetical protein